jgi:hypothetical protein
MFKNNEIQLSNFCGCISGFQKYGHVLNKPLGGGIITISVRCPALSTLTVFFVFVFLFCSFVFFFLIKFFEGRINRISGTGKEGKLNKETNSNT